MKKYGKVLTLVLACALLLAVPVTAADDGDLETAAAPVIRALGSTDSFYDSLSALIGSIDDSLYFGTIKMAVGSSALTMDGSVTLMDTAPEVEGETLMLPIRFLAECTGSSVSYDKETRSAVVETPYGDSIRCPIGTSTVLVNGTEYEIGITTYIRNGRTYVTAEALDNVLCLNIDWDKETGEITITAPWQTSRILAILPENSTVDMEALSTELGVQTVLTNQNGFWVLQFAAPDDARTAAAILEERGITASMDVYFPPMIEPIEDVQ